MVNFGEINIPSSRAFWDDFEGDEIPDAANTSFNDGDDEIKLKLQSFSEEMKDTRKTVKLLLIVEGANISEFAENILLQGMDTEWKQLVQLPGKNSAIYFHEMELRIVAIINENLTFSGKITELLLNYLNSERVITLNVKSCIDYKSEQFRSFSDQITFLRTVAITGHEKDMEQLKDQSEIPPALEVPNFISGVAAGIASWRYNAGLSVESYVAYTDKTDLDTLSAEPIIKLLQRRGIQCKEVFHSKRIQETHLYL